MASSTATRSLSRVPLSGGSCGRRPRATISRTVSAKGSWTSSGTTAIARLIAFRSRARIGSPLSLTPPLRGSRTPVRTRRSVDLPAPFGPTRAIRSPAMSDRLASATIVASPNATVTASAARIGIGFTARTPSGSGGAGRGRTARRGWPSRPRPAGRPGVAPRDRRRPAATAPKMAEIGTTRRAPAPTSSRTTCGTTRPTNPIRPVIATAAAVVIDARTRRMLRSRLTSTPRCAAAASPSSNPSSERARNPMSRHDPTMSGVAMSRRSHDAPASPPRRNEKIARRFVPDTYMAIVSKRREDRANGVAGQQEPRHPARTAGATETEDEQRRGHRTDERPDVHEPELEDREADRQQDGQGRAEGGARRRPEHVRVGERVADDALEGRPGDRQAGPDERRRQDPRQPQLPDDRLGRGGPCPPRSSPNARLQDDPERVGRADRDRADRDGGDQRDREQDQADQRDRHRSAPEPTGDAGRSKLGGDRADGHAVGQRAGGMTRSGYIARARFRIPVARRGPGRVISVSDTDRTSPFLMALNVDQPGRLAMVSAVGV